MLDVHDGQRADLRSAPNDRSRSSNGDAKETDWKEDWKTFPRHASDMPFSSGSSWRSAKAMFEKIGPRSSSSVAETPFSLGASLAAEVRRASALRREAERLIETAVRAVELAIERGEVTAMDHIERRT